MRGKRPTIRNIPFRELAECPAMRLDAEHYIPRHRRWECRHGDRLRSKARLVRPWLDGEISSDDLLETMRMWSELRSRVVLDG